MMPDYTALYRQAMAEGNHDYARTVLLSARAAAEAGALTPDQLHALVEEITANPPD